MSDSHVRQLHLNVNILHSGFVPSAWRLAESDPAAFVDVQHYVNVARIAESAKFDAVFLADNAASVDDFLLTERFRQEVTYSRSAAATLTVN